MGVDCKIHLPYNVNLRDVSKVIGLLCGLKRVEKVNHQHKGPDGEPFRYFEVEGVKVEKAGEGTLVECAMIYLKGLSGPALEIRDGEANSYVMYHFEPDDPTPLQSRLLMPRSNAFWIAIGVALVKFYGGTVDFNDCDNKEIDFKRKARSNKENCPQDGKPWQTLQDRMRAIKPLTMADFQKYA